MDPDTLKVLLDSQNQSFRSAVDIIVDQFKSRITDMETRMSDLTRSLEFTQAEVTDLKSEVKELQKSDSVKQTTINELQTHVKDIEQRTNYQEDYSRRNNLRISGIMAWKNYLVEKPGSKLPKQCKQSLKTSFNYHLQIWKELTGLDQVDTHNHELLLYHSKNSEIEKQSCVMPEN
ncbi:hypothetical protein Pmani_026644 [Petrolisthes manimaculis]|uniref:Uncharacterized protein n=1 Tax=Petrolisthes manimaculis TaxID=1843537 RepID=A0AAE1P5P0_9EUCA|nr:hypothetical protein Pmani_026644 [Petrolisthes manimaculis]